MLELLLWDAVKLLQMSYMPVRGALEAKSPVIFTPYHVIVCDFLVVILVIFIPCVAPSESFFPLALGILNNDVHPGGTFT